MKASQIQSVARLTSAAGSNNATVVKTTSGDLHSIEAYNTTASVKFLKLFNKSTTPAPATDTPFLTFAIPPNGRLYKEFSNGGVYFSAGISYALTGVHSDGDNTALTAGDVIGLNLVHS